VLARIAAACAPPDRAPRAHPNPSRQAGGEPESPASSSVSPPAWREGPGGRRGEAATGPGRTCAMDGL
jgi:hypothetical protein